MAGTRYQQDSESASFLHHGEAAKPRDHDQRTIKHRLSSPVTVPRCLVYTAVLFMAVSFVVLVAILHIVSLDGQILGKTGDSSILSQTMFGRISKKMVVFQPDRTYDVDPFGPDSTDGPWNNLSPPGKGHIRVDNPASWGLSGGFPLVDDGREGAEEYTISMFHQLHCLAAIQSKMTRLLEWYHHTNDKEYLRFVLSQENMADDHIYHCIDYIRQSIMCSGDTTLEKARTGDEGQPIRGVDGWGVGHECRSFDDIFRFAAAHRSRNITGID